jgi:hypothetical protein
VIINQVISDGSFFAAFIDLFELAAVISTELCPLASIYCSLTPQLCCNYSAAQSCCASTYLPLFSSNPVLYDYQSLALFSSKGPTSDGRLKPEVVRTTPERGLGGKF